VSKFWHEKRGATMVTHIAFIAFCALALATSASADGAWTLWMMGASSPWDSVGTFSTRELCMEALHQQAQAVEKLGLTVTEDASAGSFVATGADQDVRGQCLPDTDDPRGPRTK
jgi:Flp pilus assembly pilin Flp